MAKIDKCIFFNFFLSNINDMLKKIYILAMIFLMCLTSFYVDSSIFVYAQNGDDLVFNFRAYGDSISAGYGLEDYINYVGSQTVQKTSDVTQNSYPDLFAKQYINNFRGNIKGYGVTGIASTKLANMLKKYLDKSAEDYDEFMKTNYFTLCIGANNVFKVAQDNFQNYIEGKITDSEYRELLKQGVDKFKNDFNNIIIPALTINTNAKVFCMTIYNPYKYTLLSQMTVDTGDKIKDSLVKNSLKYLDKTFQGMLNTTMEYLQMINNIIRESASENVIVVDVYSVFEQFTSEEYSKYINADVSKIVIKDVNNINFQDFVTHADPHPSQEGHRVIANEHIKALPIVQLKLNTNFNDVTQPSQNINLSISKVGGEDYEYKLYKNINNNVVFVKNSSDGVFNIQAELLNGWGNLYVVTYLNDNVVCYSNNIAFNFSFPYDIDLNNPEEKPIVYKNNNVEIILTASILFVIGLVIIFLIVFIIKSAKIKTL